MKITGVAGGFSGDIAQMELCEGQVEKEKGKERVSSQ